LQPPKDDDFHVTTDNTPDTDTTADGTATMTPAQLAEAKAYGRISLQCDLVDRALDVGFLTLMALVLAGPVHEWLSRFAILAGDQPLAMTLRLAAMFLVTIGLHLCVSFPLSFYSGHLLEHHFGLSTQSLAGWLKRYLKRNALAVVFGALMFVGLYWIIWLTGSSWWLLAAVAFFGVSILLGQLTPVLILPLFYKIERLEDEEISRRMQRISEGTGLAIEGVYRMEMSSETVKANAMLAGLGRTQRVLMGDTLLADFSHDEIEVIFAHEIGHHVHHHIRKMIVLGAVYSTAGFWVCDRLLSMRVADYDHHPLPIETLPLLMLTLSVFSMLLEPLQNMVSRHFERQADRYALDRTKLHKAYTSAFRKLAVLNKDDPDPNAVEVFLFHSHPPISERLAMAEAP